MHYEVVDQKEGQNLLLFLKDVQSKRWVGKITRSLNYEPLNIELVDTNQRALFVYKLLGHFDLPTFSPKIVSINKLSDDQIDFQGRLNDEVFIRRYVPKVLDELDSKERKVLIEKNINDICKSIVLHIWVGNHDKKTDDYLVTENDKIVSIDHQLSGPHPNNKYKSIGAYAQAFDLTNAADVGWCVEGSTNKKGDSKIIKHLKENQVEYANFEEAVKKVEHMSKKDINELMKGINFQNKKGCLSYLLNRKTKIKPAISSWTSNDFPVKPKEILEK